MIFSCTYFSLSFFVLNFLIFQLRKKAYENLKQEKQNRIDVAAGNPLLQHLSTETSKRRWDEDTVFTNQAVKDKKNIQRGFVNDVVRSDFHRKFLNKYIIWADEQNCLKKLWAPKCTLKYDEKAPNELCWVGQLFKLLDIVIGSATLYVWRASY